MRCAAVLASPPVSQTGWLQLRLCCMLETLGSAARHPQPAPQPERGAAFAGALSARQAEQLPCHQSCRQVAPGNKPLQMGTESSTASPRCDPVPEHSRFEELLPLAVSPPLLSPHLGQGMAPGVARCSTRPWLCKRKAWLKTG